MKIFSTLFCLIFLSFPLFAQKTDEVLATANGKEYTVKNLLPETAQDWQNQAKAIAEARINLLSQLVADTLFETEAKARNVTAKQITDEAKAKVPEPSVAEIQEIYDNNRNIFAGRPLEEVKSQIVIFLRREPEQKVLQELVDSLKTKYKVSFGKDINAPDLKPLEIVATVGAKTISAQEFDEKYKLKLYEFRFDVFDEVKNNLDEVIFSDLVIAEAKARNIEASDLIAKEISDKLKNFTDEERFKVQSAFMNMLFTKYKVNFLIKEPAPAVQNISIDDDPSKGNATAPVTVVMFSDFQCPACSATHPILKKVMAEYPADKIRFVVRDFPLELVHKNAFQAALAANAAFKQGKFFEYTEILYNNQNALDIASLKKYAANLGMNPAKFEADMNDANTAAEVRKDIADGEKYGVMSTPTIFINGVKIRNNSEEGFRTAINSALKK